MKGYQILNLLRYKREKSILKVSVISTENSDEFYFLVPKVFGLFGQRCIKSPAVPVVLRMPCFSKNESQIFH